MKKIIMKGLIITTIYAVAVMCTFVMSARIEKLDSNDKALLNNNSSIVNHN